MSQSLGLFLPEKINIRHIRDSADGIGVFLLSILPKRRCM